MRAGCGNIRGFGPSAVAESRLRWSKETAMLSLNRDVLTSAPQSLALFLVNAHSRRIRVRLEQSRKICCGSVVAHSGRFEVRNTSKVSNKSGHCDVHTIPRARGSDACSKRIDMSEVRVALMSIRERLARDRRINYESTSRKRRSRGSAKPIVHRGRRVITIVSRGLL